MSRKPICSPMLIAPLLVLTAAVAVAQPPGAPPAGPRFFGGPGGPGGALGANLLVLAGREEVRQELQLIDEQLEKVDALADETRQQVGDEMRDMFAQMRDLSDEERRARFNDIRTRLEKINQEAEAKLKTILLPHQYDRLRQISVQQRIQLQGADALTSGDLAEALNLTDEQRERLELRSAEVQQELQQKIAQLRVDARNKMLDVLTPEQRAKLDSLMGDAFALPDQGPGPGGFFGRGGRGGFFFGGPARRSQRDERRPARASNDAN